MQKIQEEMFSGKKNSILSKKNKFIIIIIIITIVVLFLGAWFSYSKIDKEKQSFAMLLAWEASLNNNVVDIERKYELHVGDVFQTYGDSSLAIIEWWDGSVTRLWWNSSIQVNQSYISKNENTIQIDFTLFSGKAWSNVISFLWEDSFFHLEFQDSQASVRGTIFNVDLEKQYLSVDSHQVLVVRENGENYTVKENTPLSLDTFSFIKLQQFISEIKDKAWEDVNKKFDKEFLLKLQKQLSEKIQSITKINNEIQSHISNMPDSLKSEEYERLLSLYQDMNFLDARNIALLDSSSSELLKNKIEIEKSLLELSNKNNQKIHFQNILYDLKSAIDTESALVLESILPIVEKNKLLLEGVDLKSIWVLFDQDNILDNISIDSAKLLKNIADSVDIKSLMQEGSSTIDSIKNNLEEKTLHLFGK